MRREEIVEAFRADPVTVMSMVVTVLSMVVTVIEITITLVELLMA